MLDDQVTKKVIASVSETLDWAGGAVCRQDPAMRRSHALKQIRRVPYNAKPQVM